jgi:hypothetical protein
MRTKLNTVGGGTLVALSLIALLTVLIGYRQPPQVDEGTGAHIFPLPLNKSGPGRWNCTLVQ